MYRYDYVFDHHANQHVIFDTCVKSILEKFLGGYNCTIFAYGHTNSGKSYTIGTSYDDEFQSNTHNNISFEDYKGI